MINGKFGKNDELFFEITLITRDEFTFPVDAWLDPGFSGWLLMDEQDAIELNWQYIQRQMMITAKGESEFKICTGMVEFDRQKLTIPVHVGNGLSEFILGRQWLQNRRLVVDKQVNLLTLDISNNR